MKRWNLMLAATMVCACAAVLGAQDQAPLPPAVSDAGESEPNARTAAKLATAMPVVNFEAKRLQDAIESIRATTGVNFVIDWEALKAAGVEPEKAVSLQLTNVPADKVLRLVLQQASTGDENNSAMFRIVDGIVTISTRGQLSKVTQTRIYDIRDLLPTADADRLPIMDPPPSFDGPADAGAQEPVNRARRVRTGGDGGLFGGHNNPADDEGRVAEVVQKLVSLITNSVDPASWKQNGGNYATIEELNGRLVIKATVEAHHEIAALLGTIRKQNDAGKSSGKEQVLLEARLLFIDPETARKLEVPDAGKSAFLDHQHAAALLKSLTDDPRTIMTAAPHLVIPVGGSANLMVTAPYEYTSSFAATADDAEVYYAESSTVHEGVIFWAAVPTVSPEGVICLKLQPTIQVLDRLDDLPAPDVSPRRKLMIQRPVTRRLQLNVSASIPDGQTAILGGTMFVPAPIASPDDEKPRTTTSMFDPPGGGEAKAATQHMFVMFVRPRIVHAAATTQPGTGGSGAVSKAAGTAAIDIIDDDPRDPLTPDEVKTLAASAKTVHPIAGSEAFTADLYHQLADKDQSNVLFSPLSIQTALAMTYGGAAGATARQMAGVLHFAQVPEKTHADFAALLAALNNPPWGVRGNPVYKLTVANALWAQKDYPFKDSFMDLVKTKYRGEVASLDIAADTSKAAKTINDWVARQTRGKITDIIKPGDLIGKDHLADGRTPLVLTNAVYFKGSWMSKFKVTDTAPAAFTLTSGKTVQTPLMNQTEKFGYLENDDFQALAMNYLGGDLSMIVLLPRKAGGLKVLEQKITGENLAKWAGQTQLERVQVAFPRFKFTNEFSLNDVLQSMGMPDAFSSKADFSEMASGPSLFIGRVRHKAFVAVDEEGTEAAAATMVGMAFGGAEPVPKVFTADHPFVFLIRHNASGSILFLGRVTDPRAE